ncbi:bestrophin family ion channel [Cytophagaceae bacterium YF14B1]|uniref:Bestrophin family ion channel n=1 Tax=Xanthocytophaga flava TaxID=3048013 RepID=A0AAE3U8G6_9BACT|nr:bestrophin family ion channel [Xanthocytophaga flavus]MDJ1482642.1 bestrophin family ion channel [Xanthocytophaga flavus]
MLLNRPISIGYFINLIKYDILVIFVYSSLSLIVHHYKYLHAVSIPISVAAIIGTLISLLLAFRTSQSYERWWEARIIWGSIVNDSRTLIRQIRQFLPDDDLAQAQIDQHIVSFKDRQIIWVYALGESLRRLPFSSQVTAYLDKHKLLDKEKLPSSNIPNLLLEKHSEELKLVSNHYKLDPNKQVQLDSTLARLTDAMGKCERIKNTVFPKSYTVLIHFIIYVFLTALPFGLEEVGDVPEMVLTMLIPLLFIMIEKTAILMQDPFENRPTDTPMTAIAVTIENNLNQITGNEKASKQPVDNDKYYSM